MISQLTGRVVDVRPTSVVIDVSGVGFLVGCTPDTAASLTVSNQATLHTHLAVREDALTLYGFSSAAEREAFILAQSVSGIGPKLALAIVSCLTPAQLKQAILTENLLTLSKVPGVGKKVAQRLVLELKDKAVSIESDTEELVEEPQWKDQVVLGLQGLGYSARDADSAWDSVKDMASDPACSVADLMRAALRSLAKG